MSAAPFVKRTLSRLRPRFSVRGLFLLTFIVAIGALEYRQSFASWWRALNVALYAWFAVALVVEAIELSRRRRGIVLASADERCGWRVAIGQRICLAGVLAGCVAIEVQASEFWEALAASWITRPFVPQWYGQRNMLGPAIPWLADVCVVIALSTHSVQAARPGCVACSWTAVRWLVASVLALSVWMTASHITYFVYVVAITSMERALPKSAILPGDEPDIALRAAQFAAMAFSAASIAAVNALLLSRLARGWASALRDRVLAGLATIGIASSIWYAWWLVRDGVDYLSPAMGEALGELSPQQLLFAAVVGILVASAVAKRFASRSQSPTSPRSPFGPVAAVPAPTSRPLPLALLAAVQCDRLFYWVRQADNMEEVVWVLKSPETLLSVAVLTLAVRQLVRAFLGRQTATLVDPSPLPPLRFFAFWVACNCVVLTAIPALVAASFAAWLTPWHSLPDAWFELAESLKDFRRNIAW